MKGTQQEPTHISQGNVSLFLGSRQRESPSKAESDHMVKLFLGHKLEVNWPHFIKWV